MEGIGVHLPVHVYIPLHSSPATHESASREIPELEHQMAHEKVQSLHRGKRARRSPPSKTSVKKCMSVQIELVAEQFRRSTGLEVVKDLLGILSM